MKVKEMQRKILTESDENFIKFIRDEFEDTRKVSISDYKNNFDVLKKVDNDTLTTGIARIEMFENHFSSVKSLSFFVAIVGYLVTYYTNILTITYGNELITNVISFIIVIVIFFFISKFYILERNNTNSCVYFKSLLKHAKESKMK